MALSEKTKTVVASILIADKDDLYPDRSATDNTIKDTGTNPRIPDDIVANTTYDMHKLYTWQHGDKIYGDHAKGSKAMEEYRKDINTSFGKEKNYEKNTVYIDTLNKKVSDQLHK